MQFLCSLTMGHRCLGFSAVTGNNTYLNCVWLANWEKCQRLPRCALEDTEGEMTTASWSQTMTSWLRGVWSTPVSQYCVSPSQKYVIYKHWSLIKQAKDVTNELSLAKTSSGWKESEAIIISQFPPVCESRPLEKKSLLASSSLVSFLASSSSLVSSLATLLLVF